MPSALRLLGFKGKRVHVPEGRPPSMIVRREGDEWGVAMLHGGGEIAWLQPSAARRYAMQILEMAWLASNPGSCPRGILE